MNNFIYLVLISLIGHSNFQNKITFFESEYSSLISDFNYGVSNEEEFDELYKKFDYLYDDIEDELEDDKDNYNLKKLLNKVEAVKDFIGEISPDGRNFILYTENFNLALKELEISFSWYDQSEFCLPTIVINLWNNRYEALLIVNSTPCIYTFVGDVVYINEKHETAYSTKSTAGIIGNSIRNISSVFREKSDKMYLEKLSCEKNKYCKE